MESSLAASRDRQEISITKDGLVVKLVKVVKDGKEHFFLVLEAKNKEAKEALSRNGLC